MNIKLNPDSIRRAVMADEARRIAHEAVVDQIDDKARSYDTAIAYVLHMSSASASSGSRGFCGRSSTRTYTRASGTACVIRTARTINSCGATGLT